MALKRWVKNFFGFSRAQTNGFIILLPLVAISIFSVPFMRWWTNRGERDFSKERSALDSLAALWNNDEINVMPEDEVRALIFFPFDPNRASAEELNALGFSPGLARRLINYRAKGGTFKIKRDLMRLYGMDSLFYASLESFILLPEKAEVPEPTSFIAKREEPQKREGVRFNLNHADTTLLKTVYGIGSALSKRIVQYRESLGGFVSAHQLYQVYGLDSAVIEQLQHVSFLQDDFQPKTLNINTATEEELVVHPYISKRMARAMVTYRFQHGRYQSVEDLRKILQLDEQQINSIRPYLAVD
jgi:competence protein ComEA